MKSHHSRPAVSTIEALETRIAPAGLLEFSADAKFARWTDVDGDTVVLKASKSIFTQNAPATLFTFLESQPGDVGEQLLSLNLADLGAAAQGVSLTFTAKRTAGLGDGSVNIGSIDATGLDLGSISIPGDLGSISAGDANVSTPAITSLIVTSAGALGASTQGGAEATLNWTFRGKVSKLTVKGDFFAALGVVDNNDDNSDFNRDASIGTVTIWGDLVGGDDSLSGNPGVGSGYIFTEGNIGSLKILGEVYGGSVDFGGSVTAFGSIANTTIGGSIFGNSAMHTGEISGVLGKVKIDGSIQGGSAESSGVVTSYGAMASVIVSGSIFGGTATNTGNVFAYGPLGKVTVGGSVQGDDSPRDEDGNLFLDGETPIIIYNSGAIGSYTRIDSVTIGGDLIAGEGAFSGAVFTDLDFADIGTPDESLSRNIKNVTIHGTLQGFSFIDDGEGAFFRVPTGIYAHGQLGAVKVGALAGADPLNAAAIVALGKANPTKASEALAIGGLTVLRGVTNAEILAGFDSFGDVLNPDVQIGAIKVANSFFGSSVSAGVPYSGDGFGDESNSITVAGEGFSDGALRSRIASLTVDGYVLGNPFGDEDFVNGLVAQEIGAVKIGGAALELKKGGAPDVFQLGATHDFFVREVA